MPCPARAVAYLGAFSREDYLAQDTVSNKQGPNFPEQRVGNKGTGRLRSLLKIGLRYSLLEKFDNRSLFKKEIRMTESQN